MPRISLTQVEIDVLRSACVAYEMELGDASHDAYVPIQARETYGDDAEVTDEDVEEAEKEIDEIERRAEALNRAHQKLANVAKR